MCDRKGEKNDRKGSGKNGWKEGRKGGLGIGAVGDVGALR